MDPSDFDAVSAVLAALAASAGLGVTEGVKELARDSTTSATQRLVTLLRQRLLRNKDQVGDAKLTVLLAEPESTAAETLRSHLAALKLEDDDELVITARRLLLQAGPVAIGPGSVAATTLSISNKGGEQRIGGVYVSTNPEMDEPRNP